MTRPYTYKPELFDELHKDAIGSSPDEEYHEWIEHATEDELQSEWDHLNEYVSHSQAEAARAVAYAVSKFEALVKKTISQGAANREMALLWIMESSSADGDWLHLEYEYGLPAGYIQLT